MASPAANGKVLKDRPLRERKLISSYGNLPTELQDVMHNWAEEEGHDYARTKHGETPPVSRRQRRIKSKEAYDADWAKHVAKGNASTFYYKLQHNGSA